MKNWWKGLKPALEKQTPGLLRQECLWSEEARQNEWFEDHIHALFKETTKIKAETDKASITINELTKILKSLK